MLTCYCKKCDREVPVGDTCPECGAKLSPAKAHAVWTVEHRPVRDWLCWNEPMRLVLPVLALVALAATVSEWLLGGAGAAAALLTGGFGRTMLALLGLTVLLTLLILLGQGTDLLDCCVDSRGVQIRIWLPNPTPLKLLCRLCPPAMMKKAREESPLHEVLISERRVTWAQVRRVQYWPEKTLMLFYAPAHWLQLALPCTPHGWEDAEGILRERLGKKKPVILPASLRPPAEKKPGAKKSAGSKGTQRNHVNAPPRRKTTAADDQLLTDIRAMNEELNRQDLRERIDISC